MIKKALFTLAAIGMMMGNNSAFAQVRSVSQIRMTPRQAIYHYAKTGNKAGLRSLVQKGYKLDMNDAKGNSSLCEAVWRGDRTAVSTLMSVGANANSECMKKIPKSYKAKVGLTQPAQTIPAQSVASGAGTSAAQTGVGIGAATATGAGLSTGSMVGIGVGAAAVIGGGIALAAGGGGGGSKAPDCSGRGTKDETGVCVCNTGYAGDNCETCDAGFGSYGTNECYATKVCVNGTQQGANCVCQTGYTGELCNECASGYGNYGTSQCYATKACVNGTQQGANCVCTNNTFTGALCDQCASGYGFYGTTTCHATLACVDGTQQADACVCNGHSSGTLCDSCEDGYDFYGTTTCYATLACVNGTQQGANCVCSTTGWTGNLCDTANACTGYDYTTCPTGYAQSATCLSGDTTKLQCNNCAEGYGKYGTDVCYATMTCGTNEHQQGDQCVCDTGYELQGGVCTFTSCPANQYKSGSECLSCPANSTSQAGSTSINQCTCNSGYSLSAAGICVQNQANVAGSGYVYKLGTDTGYKVYNNNEDITHTKNINENNVDDITEIFEIYDGTLINNANINLTSNNTSVVVDVLFDIYKGNIVNNGDITVTSNGGIQLLSISDGISFNNNANINITEETTSLIQLLAVHSEQVTTTSFRNTGSIYAYGNGYGSPFCVYGLEIIHTAGNVSFFNSGLLQYRRTNESANPFWTYGIAAPEIEINNSGSLDGMFLLNNGCENGDCFNSSVGYNDYGTQLTFINSGELNNGYGQDWAAQIQKASIYATVLDGNLENTTSGVINGDIFIEGKSTSNNFAIDNNGQINGKIVLAGQNVSFNNTNSIAHTISAGLHGGLDAITLHLDGQNINAINYGTIKGVYNGENSFGHIIVENASSLTNESTGKIYGIINLDAGNFENNGNVYGYILGLNSNITNNGTITVTDDFEAGTAGIAAVNSTVINTGTIIISNYGTATGMNAFDYCDTNQCYEYNDKWYKDEAHTQEVIRTNYIDLAENSLLLTSGTLSSSGVLSMASFSPDGTGTVTALPGATLSSPVAIRDDLHIANDFVTNGFNTTYTASGLIDTPDTTGLNLISNSAMFNARLADNGSDVIMQMKSFDELTNNKSLASFLENNYSLGNNEAFFNDLKQIGTANAFTGTLNSLTGLDTVSRFAYEDLSAVREINFAMNEQMFANDDKPLFETQGSLNGFSFKNDNNSSASYALAQKRITPRMKIGYAMSNTTLNTDDSNDTTRSNQMFQVFMPVGYNRAGWKMIATPQIGFARGHYTRSGYNDGSYKGTLEKRMFALMNEARYPVEFAGMTFEPTVEFNAIAYNQRGNEDAKAYSLTIPSDNNISVEGGLGLYAKRNIGKLKLNAGLMMYREFADPYNIKLGMQGMEGSFNLYDDKRSEYRGVASFGFGYELGSINMYGNLQHFMESDTHTTVKAGLKVGF